MSDEFGSVPSDTSRVEGIGGGRKCPKCGVTKQWRQGQWVCLTHENATPADWKHPMSGGLTVKGGLDERDKVEIVKLDSKASSIKNTTDQVKLSTEKIKVISSSLVSIPFQAREEFQKLKWANLNVDLSKEQSQELLNQLYNMPTPGKMSDAKAIIGLVNDLEERIKNAD